MIQIFVYLIDGQNKRNVRGPFSTTDQLNVGYWKDQSVYAVTFMKNEWMKLDPAVFVDSLTDTMLKHVPSDQYKYTLVFCHFETPDVETWNQAAAIYAAFAAVKDQFTLVESMDSKTRLREFEKPITEDDEDREWYEDFDSDYDEEEDDVDYPHINDLKKPKPAKKQYYGQSRVWKNSNHIKRSINRHGVVVSSKDNRKRDIKLIKEFLKDFIPGNQGWKKDFRKELAKRWLDVYCISKGQLKSLEKSYRNKNSKGSKTKSLNSALGLAGRIIKNPSSDWFNPNK